jgi:hypothetical protein
MVRQTNSYGYWNEVRPASFSIRGPVYATSWFIILCAACRGRVYLFITFARNTEERVGAS